MKSSLKAKLIQHLAAKKGNAGFTLIELLVVIIIIGILSAIALPSFLNQANKAKQSEAKTYVGSMNRAQQAYYLEKGEFITGLGTDNADLAKLGLGISQATDYYAYDIAPMATGTVGTVNQAKPVNGPGGATDYSALKAYVGGVAVGTQTDTGEATTLAILCESNQAEIPAAADLGGELATYDQTDGMGCPDTYDTIN